MRWSFYSFSALLQELLVILLTLKSLSLMKKYSIHECITDSIREGEPTCNEYSYSYSCLFDSVIFDLTNYDLFLTTQLSHCVNCCASFWLTNLSPFWINARKSGDGALLMYSTWNLSSIFNGTHNIQSSPSFHQGRIEKKYEHIPRPKIVFMDSIEGAKRIINRASSIAQSLIILSSLKELKPSLSVPGVKKVWEELLVNPLVLKWYIFGSITADKSNRLLPSRHKIGILPLGVRRYFTLSQQNRQHQNKTRNITLSCFIFTPTADFKYLHSSNQSCVSLLGAEQCRQCKTLINSLPPLDNSYYQTLRYKYILLSNKYLYK